MVERQGAGFDPVLSSRNPEPRQTAPLRLFGRSEVWRDDSTGTATFDILFIRVWKRDFTHSTWMSK